MENFQYGSNRMENKGKTVMGQHADKLVQCTYCRQFSPAGESECPWCGAPLPDSSPVQTTPSAETGESKQVTLSELVEKSNQDLVSASTRAAELAFGIGCTLGVIVSVILLLGIALIIIIFSSIRSDWIILAVALLILALISFLVSSFLSTRARRATTRTVYDKNIKPEIDRYLTANSIDRREFFKEAAEILPEGSPLLASLEFQDI